MGVFSSRYSSDMNLCHGYLGIFPVHLGLFKRIWTEANMQQKN